MPQLTTGTYTCPISLDEVCRIRRRGRKPSATACRVTENAPEMTACDAITVASVASTTIGSCSMSGTSR